MWSVAEVWEFLGHGEGLGSEFPFDCAGSVRVMAAGREAGERPGLQPWLWGQGALAECTQVNESPYPGTCSLMGSVSFKFSPKSTDFKWKSVASSSGCQVSPGIGMKSLQNKMINIDVYGVPPARGLVPGGPSVSEQIQHIAVTRPCPGVPWRSRGTADTDLSPCSPCPASICVLSEDSPSSMFRKDPSPRAGCLLTVLCSSGCRLCPHTWLARADPSCLRRKP